jgi:hypothetical protein
VACLTYLDCKFCERPILLPSSPRSGLPRDPAWWPKNRPVVNFLCPHCKRACQYSLTGVRRAPRDTGPMPALPAQRAILAAATPCGTHNCASHTKIYALTLTGEGPPAEANSRTAAMPLFSETIPFGIVCQAGHFVRRDFLGDGSSTSFDLVSAGLDEEEPEPCF